VHLHGGELRSGRKNHEGLPLIYGLARRGWVCISANYRLSPGATFPEHLIDVKKVIAWARTHGAEYGADPSLIFLAGVSAGAQLTALAACTAGEPEYQPGFETADTAISGAVTLSGLYGPRSVPGAGPGSSALPCAHVHPQVPPFFIAHGDMDSVLAVEGARDFASALRRVSRSPVVYAELRGAQHSFDLFRSLYADNLVSAVESFATWVHAHEKQGHHRLQSGRQSSIESGGGARGVHQ
jgi:acetyl esterase/lipase